MCGMHSRAEVSLRSVYMCLHARLGVTVGVAVGNLDGHMCIGAALLIGMPQLSLHFFFAAVRTCQEEIEGQLLVSWSTGQHTAEGECLVHR